MVRFYWPVVKRAFVVFFETTDRGRKVLGVVLYLLTFLVFFNEPIGKQLLRTWEGFPSWYGAIPLLLLFIYGFLKADYERHSETQQRLAEQRSLVKELAERLRPKFKFVFQPDVPPYRQETPMGSGTGKGVHRLFRVGIESQTDATIQGLRVLVVDLQPQGVPFAPIELREMNDPIGDASRAGFALNGRTTRFFDVVEKVTTSLFSVWQDQEIHLVYAVVGRPVPIPPREYTLRLRAEALDMLFIEADFEIGVGKGGLLVLRHPNSW